MEDNSWEKTQKKLFAMVSTGVTDSRLNQCYDIVSTLALVANIVCAFASTFENLDAKYGLLFDYVDAITVFFFAIDYVLRIITAEQQAISKMLPSLSMNPMLPAYASLLLSFCRKSFPTAMLQKWKRTRCLAALCLIPKTSPFAPASAHLMLRPS